MYTRPPANDLEKVDPPHGPVLCPGETRPEDVRAWRRDRLAHCIGTLLRDPAVARAVGAAVRGRTTGEAPGHAPPGCRTYWLDSVHRGRPRP